MVAFVIKWLLWLSHSLLSFFFVRWVQSENYWTNEMRRNRTYFFWRGVGGASSSGWHPSSKEFWCSNGQVSLSHFFIASCKQSCDLFKSLVQMSPYSLSPFTIVHRCRYSVLTKYWLFLFLRRYNGEHVNVNFPKHSYNWDFPLFV